MVERKSTNPATGKSKVNVNLEMDETDPPRSTVDSGEVLSIADEQDSGGDPYNSTGQFVQLQIKRDD